jgi:hypothetical protein
MIRKLLLIFGILLLLVPLIREVPPGIESYEMGLDLILAKDIALLLGVLILFIAYYKTKSNYFIFLMLIFSTTLMYLASTFSIDMLAITSLVLYYNFRKKPYGLIFLISTIAIKWPYFILASLLVIPSMKKKELKKYFLGILLTSPLLFLNNNGFTLEKTIYFADLGIISGIGLFAFVLIIFGIFNTWKKHKQENIMFLLIILFSIFVREARIFVGIVGVYYAGAFLKWLHERKWSLELLKKTTFILIVCGVLFSVLVQSGNILKTNPTEEMLNSIYWLENKEKVLVPQEYIVWFQYYLDNVYINETGIQNYYYANNIDFIKEEFNKTGIKYIYIDKQTKNAYWPNNEKLYFLLENSKNFKRAYSSKVDEIWEYEE